MLLRHKLNLSQPPAVQPGEHKAIIVEASAAVSKKGNDMLVLRLAVEPTRKVLLKEFIPFTDGMDWLIESFMASIGSPIADGEEVEIADPSKLVGRSCYVRLGPRTGDKGKTYLEIEEWLPAPNHKEALASLDTSESEGDGNPF